MESLLMLDRAGRRRSPATTSSFHQGLPPRNRDRRYPPDPPTVEEIIAVMRAAGDASDGPRLRGVIVMLWRAGLRISEALALNETDLDPDRGAPFLSATAKAAYVEFDICCPMLRRELCCHRSNVGAIAGDRACRRNIFRAG
jgi:integrase